MSTRSVAAQKSSPSAEGSGGSHQRQRAG
jgi:hypothetical protein